MSKPTAIFWVVAIISLLWYLMGSASYVFSHYYTAEDLVPIYGEVGSQIIMDRPIWQVAGWAIAVFAGLLGSIGLLMRKSWPRLLFMLALLGGIVYNIWVFTSGYFSHSTGFDKFIFAASVIVPILLIWFTRKNTANGVLS